MVDDLTLYSGKTLDEIESLANEMPGRIWRAHDMEHATVVTDRGLAIADCNGRSWSETKNALHAVFISTARNAIPALIADIRELEKTVAGLREGQQRAVPPITIFTGEP